MKRMIFVCLVLLAVSAAAFAGGGKQSGQSAGGAVEFSLISVNSGNDGSFQTTQYRVQKFNELYAGKYKAVVETRRRRGSAGKI